MNIKLVVLIFCSLFIYNSSSISAKPKKNKKDKKNKGGGIPATIKGVLTLKPRKEPYLLSNTTIPKGATLNLLAGVTVESDKNADKGATLIVNGTLNILGKKGKPVIMSIVRLYVNGGKLNVSYGQLKISRSKLTSNAVGKISNTTIKNTTKYTRSPTITIFPPDDGMIIFDNCCFFNTAVLVKEVELPADMNHLRFNRCAFLLIKKKVDGKERSVMRKMPSEIFALGTKCDVEHQVVYNAMNWQFKTKLKREWYFYVDSTKKAIHDMVKSNKSMSIKYSSKPLTSYNPAVEAKSIIKKKKK